jgi:hypothetical protein
MQTRLWVHPADKNMAVDGDIGVTVERLSAATLRLRFLVHGRIDALVLPPPAPPLRANNLWRTTCFEAFLAPAAGPGYRELNFSPSSQWAAYEFSAYRADMIEAPVFAPPDIEMVTSSDRLELAVTLSLGLGEDPYRLNLAAVIEERGGAQSHWAVNHPGGGAPDFHHHACFALELPPAPGP